MFKKLIDWWKAKDIDVRWDYVYFTTFIVIMATVAALWFWFAWVYSNEQMITVMTKEEAQTSQGVHRAAINAGVTLDTEQAKAAAKEIKHINESKQEPIYIVRTTAKEAEVEAEKAAEKAKADFSIVTNKNSGEEIKNLEDLPDGSTVELNQYNVQAYKPVIRQISYSPQEKRAGISISKKISKDGKYIGIGADYDIDDAKVYAKIVYSW